jgi:hypothetical protein
MACLSGEMVVSETPLKRPSSMSSNPTTATSWGTRRPRSVNLRENLVPYTLTEEANTTGVPVVRPTYVEYPDKQQVYATAGTTATTSVCFPPGQWTDYFTGRTYAGGIVPTRTDDVTGNDRNPLTKVTLQHTVRIGPAAGSFRGQVTGREWAVSFVNSTAPTYR